MPAAPERKDLTSPAVVDWTSYSCKDYLTVADGQSFAVLIPLELDFEIARQKRSSVQQLAG